MLLIGGSNRMITTGISSECCLDRCSWSMPLLTKLTTQTFLGADILDCCDVVSIESNLVSMMSRIYSGTSLIRTSRGPTDLFELEKFSPCLYIYTVKLCKQEAEAS